MEAVKIEACARYPSIPREISRKRARLAEEIEQSMIALFY